MLNFQNVTQEIFLNDYWQKKPLLIKGALPHFPQPLDANELAGLAMEEEIESRIVINMPDETPQWHLKRGPFLEADFDALPKSHWTLLVQGVDRFLPEVRALLDAFDFLPQWRVDDVMISYASTHGSVGPHYDNYDVFLYQARGQRKWSLTTKHCNEQNALPGVDLRIMAEFEVEQEILLSEGDMLYLPPHVGHHGLSLSDDCLGYSFGYRSYNAQEMWDSFGDYLSEQHLATRLYRDPDWNELKGNPSEIPRGAVMQARELMLGLLNDERQLQQWFSRFATQLDEQATQLLPQPLDNEEAGDINAFIDELKSSEGFSRDLNTRMAYHLDEGVIQFFVNGYPFDYGSADPDLVKWVAEKRELGSLQLGPMLSDKANQLFLYDLWKQQLLLIDVLDD